MRRKSLFAERPEGARPAPNVPAQSLAMLNDPLVAKLAVQWGRDMRADRSHDSDAARPAHLFEALTGREPAAAELEALGEYAELCWAGVRGDLRTAD